MLKIFLVIAIGISIRILLIQYANYLDQNGVQFSDIDYSVFTQASEYLRDGYSPYQRHTYRYSPYLAMILLWIDGKYLFLIFDLINCVLIGLMFYSYKTCYILVGIYSMNPIYIYLTCRGSSDSIIVTGMLLSVYFVVRRNYLLGGIFYGLATHWRVYPIIFCLAFYLHIDYKKKKWITTNKIIFTLISAATFILVTSIAIYIYPQYLHQGILYHFLRKDHRHSYSPMFLITYLFPNLPIIPAILLALPQPLLILSITAKYYKDISLCIPLITYIFIIYNKVYTLQYLLWIAVGIIPLSRNKIVMEGKVRQGIILSMWFLLGILGWWYFAIKLEGQGESIFWELQLVNLGKLISNCYILHRLMKYQLIGREIILNHANKVK